MSGTIHLLFSADLALAAAAFVLESFFLIHEYVIRTKREAGTLNCISKGEIENKLV